MIVATQLPESDEARAAVRLCARVGATLGEPSAAIQNAIRSITELLAGANRDLSWLVCDLDSVDAFAARVYIATREIPPGETLTYGDIASQLGDRRLARRVGQALGRNPFPIVIPCHRVVGAGGRLTGFSAPGGVATKLRLLAIENTRIGEAPGLFSKLPLMVNPRR